MTEAISSRAHALSADEVALALEVSATRGLSGAQARIRLDQHGPNELEEHDRPSVWRALLGAASEPFILLLVAAGVGAVLLGEVRDGLFVLGGLVPIVGADVATTYRSERALAELRNAVAPRAQVLRDGLRHDLPAREIVPGDVLLLAAGDIVPADARVLPGGGLLVDRSILTGESVPEEANPAPDPPEAPLAERRSIIYAGTSIVGGRGGALVVATGSATQLGAIAATLGTDPRRRSPLQRELDRLVRILLVAAIVLITITVGLGFLRGQPAGANLLAGISAAITAIPEEPPVLLAVILGLGAYRLMRRGVMVRRLAAQEALGAVDLIITDKTGTLTRNRLVVDELLRPNQPIDSAEADRLLLEALEAEEDAWAPAAASRRGSFTQAIEAALHERGVPCELEERLVISAVGTADRRPYTMVRHAEGAGWRELALGAPEVVLAFDVSMDLAARASWTRLIEDEAGRGGRLLLLAARDDARPWQVQVLIRFGDPLRPEVPDAVATAIRAGIQTMMVTGDHLDTATAIADAVGLPPGDGITGPQLQRLSDEVLAQRLPGLRLVARAVPEPEATARAHRPGTWSVGSSHRRWGERRASAAGVRTWRWRWASGTAVAREASDLVLGDDSFDDLDGRAAQRAGASLLTSRRGWSSSSPTHVALLGFILIATVAGFGQPLLPLQSCGSSSSSTFPRRSLSSVNRRSRARCGTPRVREPGPFSTAGSSSASRGQGPSAPARPFSSWSRIRAASSTPAGWRSRRSSWRRRSAPTPIAVCRNLCVDSAGISSWHRPVWL